MRQKLFIDLMRAIEDHKARDGLNMASWHYGKAQAAGKDMSEFGAGWKAAVFAIFPMIEGTYSCAIEAAFEDLKDQGLTLSQRAILERYIKIVLDYYREGESVDNILPSSAMAMVREAKHFEDL